MDGCTKGPQLEEDENLTTRAPGTGRTPLGKLDNRGQEKVTPRKLFNEESGGARSENSQMSPSTEEVEGYSFDGSSRSKSKSAKLKPQSVRVSRRKSSSDLGYDTVSDSVLEDLSMPYRQREPMPFTSSMVQDVLPDTKWYDKDPTEIHGIKRKPNEGLQAIMDYFKPKSSMTRSQKQLMRCRRESGLSSGEKQWQTQPKSSDLLSKKRMLTPKEILAIDNVNFPPPALMVGTLEKRNMNKFCDYHQDRGHNMNDCYHLKKQIEEVLASGRLAHLVKDIRQGGQKSKGSAKGNDKVINMTTATEALFLEMKKLVSELPTLTTPKKGESLMMYLVAANEAVSTMLLIERDMRQMPIHYMRDIYAFVDSKLVASQVEGSYEAKGERMIKYREKVLELAGAFNRFQITYIPRAENRKADALSKLAVVQFDHLSKEVLRGNMVVEGEGSTWMTSIRNYLENGELPKDPVDARTLMEKIGNYTIEDGVLYMKSYLVPLMRCVGPLQDNYIIREVHMGSCGMHDWPRQVVAKAMKLGYFWPSMHRDANDLIRACDDCQAHASGPGRVKYLIMAIDYFTKWMEAKPLATITGKQVVNFTWENIVCRFGIPAIFITDNGTPFGNGAVERANRSLLREIKTRLENGGSAWAKEVPNVLWAHQIIKKTSTGATPFSLTYGTEAVIPAEIGMPTHKTSSVNEKINDQELHLNLDLLDKRKEIAAIREAKYKQQVDKYYNKKVRYVQFKVGEFVLRKNEVSRAATQAS
nr:hypothetical protein [Tanacetum cinerariifolium]